MPIKEDRLLPSQQPHTNKKNSPNCTQSLLQVYYRIYFEPPRLLSANTIIISEKREDHFTLQLSSQSRSRRSAKLVSILSTTEIQLLYFEEYWAQILERLTRTRVPNFVNCSTADHEWLKQMRALTCYSDLHA